MYELAKRTDPALQRAQTGLERLRGRLREVDPLHDVDTEALRRFETSRAAWRKIREDRGLSQSDVAALMRTSQSVVSELESGNADPRLSTVRRYLAALRRCMIIQPCLPGQPDVVEQVTFFGEIVRCTLNQGQHKVTSDAATLEIIVNQQLVERFNQHAIYSSSSTPTIAMHRELTSA